MHNVQLTILKTTDKIMLVGKGNEIRERCLNFAVDIIKLTNEFPGNSAGFELSK